MEGIQQQANSSESGLPPNDKKKCCDYTNEQVVHDEHNHLASKMKFVCEMISFLLWLLCDVILRLLRDFKCKSDVAEATNQVGGDLQELVLPKHSVSVGAGVLVIAVGKANSLNHESELCGPKEVEEEEMSIPRDEQQVEKPIDSSVVVGTEEEKTTDPPVKEGSDKESNATGLSVKPADSAEGEDKSQPASKPALERKGYFLAESAEVKESMMATLLTSAIEVFLHWLPLPAPESRVSAAIKVFIWFIQFQAEVLFLVVNVLYYSIQMIAWPESDTSSPDGPSEQLSNKRTHATDPQLVEAVQCHGEHDSSPNCFRGDSTPNHLTERPGEEDPSVRQNPSSGVETPTSGGGGASIVTLETAEPYDPRPQEDLNQQYLNPVAVQHVQKARVREKDSSEVEQSQFWIPFVAPYGDTEDLCMLSRECTENTCGHTSLPVFVNTPALQQYPELPMGTVAVFV